MLHRGDRAAFRLSGGHWTLTTALTGLPVALVTTTGARTGLPRTLPLLCVRVQPNDANFALIGTNFGRARVPGWCYNLRADARANVLVDRQPVAHVAHEARGDEYDRYWRAAEMTYAGYRAYRARVTGRPIPIMVLTPCAPLV